MSDVQATLFRPRTKDDDDDDDDDDGDDDATRL